jgi:glyoxylase-like metal-dependent hydrolase (beta-lactamase superfamily II)
VFFRQVQQHGDNFSYIIADKKTHEASVVDCSFNAGKLSRILQDEGFKLKYIINTHGHSDHTAGNSQIQQGFGAQIVAHKQTTTICDVKVDDGDTLNVGEVKIKVIYTPGHTKDGICLLVDGEKLLTGDTLFVGECGRTDMPGGDPKELYQSLFGKILSLPDSVEVYPGHDYGPAPSSTVGKERKTNYVLKPRSQNEFVEFMKQP